MSAINWTCPHCNTPQTVVSEKRDSNTRQIHVGHPPDEILAIAHYSTGCSNPECGKTTVRVRLGKAKHDGRYLRFSPGSSIFDQCISPQGAAKPLPDYVPAPLAADYYEACLIRDLSPKASATLTRRCLQGMIRDFAGISRARLIDEIKALSKAVESGEADRSISEESVEAIDHVRGLGNIGAHMEKDINMIVDVDAGEAQALIELVEMLFDEWYGEREKRRARLAKVSAIAAEKKEQVSRLKEEGGSLLPAPPGAEPSDGKNALLGLIGPKTRD